MTTGLRAVRLGAFALLAACGPSASPQSTAQSSVTQQRGNANTARELTERGPRAPARPTTPCTVARVVDGDSLECRDSTRVRLVGIDAPELSQQPFAARSRDALRALAPIGAVVQLEPDVAPRDQYGRLLAYVWRDAHMINWRLVRDGWAVLFTFAPNVQHADSLRAAQTRARGDTAGLWRVNGFACLPTSRRQRRC